VRMAGRASSARANRRPPGRSRTRAGFGARTGPSAGAGGSRTVIRSAVARGRTAAEPPADKDCAYCGNSGSFVAGAPFRAESMHSPHRARTRGRRLRHSMPARGHEKRASPRGDSPFKTPARLADGLGPKGSPFRMVGIHPEVWVPRFADCELGVIAIMF
jgi:hypothetical protein